ncbi:6-bladed beta-propeller [Ferruginibacter sp.]
MLTKPLPVLFFIFITFLSAAGCFAQEKIYFEPKSAAGGKQSDFITINSYVVFETTSESRFDRYSRIIPTKKFFVVCDYSAKKIFVFDKSGRFIKKFGNKLDFGRLTYNEQKDGLEMVTTNKMYRLTNKDNAEILEDYQNPKNLKYFRKYFIDLTDTLHFSVHKQKITHTDILNPVPYINGMHYVNKITVDKNFEKKEDYELKIYRGDSLLKQYFKYDKKKDSRYIFDGGNVTVSSAAKEDQRWVTHPYDYSVYALQNDSLYKVYDMILPMDRAIPADFLSKDFQNRTEKDNYLRQNRRLVKQFYVYNVSGRYLNFTMQTMMFEWQQFLYDTKTKTFYSQDKISPDSSTYYLPLCRNVAFNDGHTVYARMYAADGQKILEDHKKDDVKYPPLLEAYFKTATADSNPVLINFNYRN